MKAPFSPIEVHPLTADRWDDLAALFGKSGAFSASNGQKNREALRALVGGERPPEARWWIDEQSTLTYVIPRAQDCILGGTA